MNVLARVFIFLDSINYLWCLYFNTDRKESRTNSRSNVSFKTLNKSISYKWNLVPQQLKIKNTPDQAFEWRWDFHVSHTINLSFMLHFYCLIAKSCPTLLWPLLARILCPWLSQARTFEWVATSFSRDSSQPRVWTHISCIGRWILYHWATREANVALDCLELCHQSFPLLILGFVISTWQNTKMVVVILKLIWIMVIWKSPLMI